jgi:hypothetical protein
MVNALAVARRERAATAIFIFKKRVINTFYGEGRKVIIMPTRRCGGVFSCTLDTLIHVSTKGPVDMVLLMG